MEGYMMDFNELAQLIHTMLENANIQEQANKIMSEKQEKYKLLHDFYGRYENSKPKNLYEAIMKREDFYNACKQVNSVK